jgi:hypothetical protein
MNYFEGPGRRPVPIGDLRGDLSDIAIIAVSRIKSKKSPEWLLWHDVFGNVYFGEFNSKSAQEVMNKHPELRICNYRYTKLYKIKGADILDDLQDTAARFFVRDSVREAA